MMIDYHTLTSPQFETAVNAIRCDKSLGTFYLYLTSMDTVQPTAITFTDNNIVKFPNFITQFNIMYIFKVNIVNIIRSIFDISAIG